MIDFSKFKSLISLVNYFNTSEMCKQAIIESRWGVGTLQDIICPYCGQHHCHKRKDGRFCCSHCKRNFSCLVGTIFENTKVPIPKWMVAIFHFSRDGCYQILRCQFAVHRQPKTSLHRLAVK